MPKSSGFSSEDDRVFGVQGIHEYNVCHAREEGYDSQRIRSCLANLKTHSKEKIKTLRGKVKEDFETLTLYVQWTYGSESYPAFYNDIRSYFSEDEKYLPGTVGAYCGGCLPKGKADVARGCTVICAGSIPPPYTDSDWEFCSQTAIWAVYTGEKFEFSRLNEVKSSEGIVFVEYSTLEVFPGFTQDEKESLLLMGVTRIRIMHYQPNANPVYREISEGFVDLDQVKERSTNPPLPGVESNWTWWIVIIIAIVLFALFFCFSRGDWKW